MLCDEMLQPNDLVRSRDQIRADAFTELLLESDVFDLSAGSPAEAIDARIQLIAPAELTALADTNTGADGDADGDLLVELVGYGPIDTDTARELAVSASHWEDTRVHPDTGVVLSVDRYRPSAEMRGCSGHAIRPAGSPVAECPCTAATSTTPSTRQKAAKRAPRTCQHSAGVITR